MLGPPARDPFFDKSTPKHGSPIHVKVAATLLLILAVYAAVMALPLCLAGAMMNQMMFIAGIVHVMIAASGFASWYGLSNRMSWARWLAIGLAALGMLVLPYAILEGWMSGVFEQGALVFGGVVSTYCSAMMWTLIHPSVGEWLST